MFALWWMAAECLHDFHDVHVGYGMVFVYIIAYYATLSSHQIFPIEGMQAHYVEENMKFCSNVYLLKSSQIRDFPEINMKLQISENSELASTGRINVFTKNNLTHISDNTWIMVIGMTETS